MFGKLKELLDWYKIKKLWKLKFLFKPVYIKNKILGHLKKGQETNHEACLGIVGCDLPIKAISVDWNYWSSI